MRKKLLVVWIVIIAGLFAWASLRRQEQDAQKRVENQQQQVEKNEVAAKEDKSDSKPIFETEHSPLAVTPEGEALTITPDELQNFTITDQEIFEKWQGKESELAKALFAAAKDTTECLKEDLCGEKPSENEPYFDANNTRSHQLLERELGLLIQLREQNLLESALIPTEQIESTLDIKNSAIQTMALELRLAAGIDDNSYQSLLDRTPSLLPQASATSLALLAKESRLSQGRREELMKTANTLLRSDDQVRAVEMSKRVKYLDADKAELEQLAKSSCGLLPQNQKTVQYNLSIAAEGVGGNLDFNCQ